MILWQWDGGWYQVRLIWGLSIGFGVLYIPRNNQVGIVFGGLSLIFTWDDSEAYQNETDEEMGSCSV